MLRKILQCILFIVPLAAIPCTAFSMYNGYYSQYGSQECGICMERQQGHQFVRLHCNHAQHCRTCLQQLINNAIREQNTEQLCCPEPTCREPFTQRDLTNITNNNQAQLTRLQEIRRQEILNRDPNFRNCPTANCKHTYLFAAPTQQMECPQCHAHYCADCLLNHDASTTCAQAKEAATEDWQRTHNVKQCPNCRFGVEKDGGCNHMTCRKCKYEFCWLCLIKWPGFAAYGHDCPGYGEVPRVQQTPAIAVPQPAPVPVAQPAVQQAAAMLQAMHLQAHNPALASFTLQTQQGECRLNIMTNGTIQATHAAVQRNIEESLQGRSQTARVRLANNGQARLVIKRRFPEPRFEEELQISLVRQHGERYIVVRNAQNQALEVNIPVRTGLHREARAPQIHPLLQEMVNFEAHA